MKDILTIKTKTSTQLLNSMRSEGWKLTKPVWPTYFGRTPDGKLTIVHLCRQGEKISQQLAKSLKMFEEEGIHVEVIVQKYRGKRKRDVNNTNTN